MRKVWMGLLIGLFVAALIPWIHGSAQAMGSNGGKKETTVQSGGQTMGEDKNQAEDEEMGEDESSEESETEESQ
ncbi:MAG: hypothetical protein AB1439_01035 [candidate division FCPU426 bacterium]